MILLVNHLFPIFELIRLRVGLDGELPEQTIMGLPNVPSILLGPLGLPLSREGRNAFKILKYKVARVWRRPTPNLPKSGKL